MAPVFSGGNLTWANHAGGGSSVGTMSHGPAGVAGGFRNGSVGSFGAGQFGAAGGFDNHVSGDAIDPRHLSASLGPLLIGGLIYTALYGNTCTLVVSYFRNHERDGWLFRFLIFILWLMTTTSVALYCHSAYTLLVTEFSNTSYFTARTLPWSLLSQSALMGLMSFIVRGMFARRLWKLSKHDYPVTIAVIVLSLANLFCLSMLTVDSFANANGKGLRESRVVIEAAAFATSVAADMALTVALCYYLWKSRTDVPGTDAVLRELMWYTLNTGLLIVVDVVVSLVLFLTIMRMNLIFIPTYIISAVLYFNSFLLSLNMRYEFRDRFENSVRVLGMESPRVSRLAIQLGTPMDSAPLSVNQRPTPSHMTLMGRTTYSENSVIVEPVGEIRPLVTTP